MSGQDSYHSRIRECIASVGSIDVTLIPAVRRKKLAKLMARSRMVVAAAKWDTAPRIVQEALCCDTPVFMNEEMLCGAKYITTETGVRKPLSQLAEGMVEILSTPDRFRPRERFLASVNPEKTLLRFVQVVREVSMSDKSFYRRIVERDNAKWGA